MPFSALHFDTLVCIAEQLDAADLVQLGRCCRALLPVGREDSLWKKLCGAQYGVTYNHPDQTYSTLYRQIVQRTFGRPPCRHLSHVSPSHVPASLDLLLETASSCCRCADRGPEKVFLCIVCHLPLCDRHARLHAEHPVAVKGNTGELFCQQCVDWLGGTDSNPAERYQVSLIHQAWDPVLYGSDTAGLGASKIALRERRQHERYLRWKDTPSHIVLNPRGFCFVSAQFMWEWERFIEGWRTEPPLEEAINAEHRNRDAWDSEPEIRFDPFLPEATDLLMVSTETWEYLENAYLVAGPKITEDDLMHCEIYRQWRYTMMRYRDRVMLRY